MNGLMLGQETIETFHYQLTDGLGSISTAPIQVTVQGVNTAPTISYISDVVISQDASTQVIDLRQLSSGDGTDQPISVTATSTRADLTGDLLLSVLEKSRNGTLQFTPAVGSYGSADSEGSASITTCARSEKESVSGAILYYKKGKNEQTICPSIGRR